MPVKAIIDDIPPSQLPKRRWEIVSRYQDRLFSTVGFTKAVGNKGQKNAAHGASIRLEILKTAFQGEHKDRRVVKVSVPTAREIAESIIEACDQAERGEAVYTKRS